MNERFESTREQIMNIDWSNEESDKPSHAVLLFEFYRRRAIFLDHLSIETAQRRAFFSAAKESEIELPIDIEAMCPELELIKNEWLVKWTCLFSLEWAYLIDRKIPIALKFHDMYIPIIELFKRGGRVRYHHADIICGKIGRSRIPSSSLSEYESRDISNEVLDIMDNAWYYKQLDMNVFFDILNTNEQSAEEIASQLFERLKNSKFTLGVSVIVQTILGELLLDNDIVAVEYLKNVESELLTYKMSELNTLLPESEKKDLSMRIHDLLIRLQGI